MHCTKTVIGLYYFQTKFDFTFFPVLQFFIKIYLFNIFVSVLQPFERPLTMIYIKNVRLSHSTNSGLLRME